MTIKLEIVAGNAAELRNRLHDLLGTLTVQHEPQPEEVSVAEEANGKKPRGRPAKAKSTVLDDAPEEAEAEEVVTKEMMLKVLTDYMDANGEAATAALLKKHGKAAKVSLVAEKHYAAVRNAALAAMS